MLIKEMQSPFGATVGYHAVVRIEIDAGNASGHAVAQVSSWPSEEAYILHERTGPTYVWYVPVPQALLSGPDLVVCCEGALAAAVYPENPFAGASVVPLASDLNAARVKRWAMLKQTREMVATSPIIWDGSSFDADTQSQALIAGAIRGMELSGRDSIDWTLSDNTVRTLTLAQLRDVGLAILARTDACYSIARDLREQLFDPALTTAEEVQAVVWPTVWPPQSEV